MKLLNFQFGTGGTSLFGVVIKGHGVSFKTLLHKSGQTRGELSGVYSYLENLPSSEDAARELMKYGEANISSLNAEEKITLEKVRILAPISTPRALIDFGLSPRHLGNSAATLIKHKFGIFGSIIAPIVKKRIKRSGRFVTQKHRRIFGNGAGNRHTLLFAPGELGGKMIQPVG